MDRDCDHRRKLQAHYATAVEALGHAVREAKRSGAFDPKLARKMVSEADEACKTAFKQLIDHIDEHRCPPPRRPGHRVEDRQRKVRVIELSHDAILVFVLWNGCLGKLRNGRIERSGPRHLDVYSPDRDTLNEYVSGPKLRSWCVVNLDGIPIGDWYCIAPEDRARLGPPIPSF